MVEENGGAFHWLSLQSNTQRSYACGECIEPAVCTCTWFLFALQQSYPVYRWSFRKFACGNKLCKTLRRGIFLAENVCYVSIGTFKDLISFSTKKVFLSLVYRPGKMKLPKGKKKLLWPSLPYPKQVFFFIAFKLCPCPLNITLNFTWLRRKILLIPGMVVRQF